LSELDFYCKSVVMTQNRTSESMGRTACVAAPSNFSIQSAMEAGHRTGVAPDRMRKRGEEKHSMARASKVRGVLFVAGGCVALLGIVAAKWLLPVNAAGEKGNDAAAVAAAEEPAATRPAPDPTSVVRAGSIRRPVYVEPAKPAATNTVKSTAWMDAVLSGSKTSDSSVIGGVSPGSIDLRTPPAPIIADPPAFGTK